MQPPHTTHLPHSFCSQCYNSAPAQCLSHHCHPSSAVMMAAAVASPKATKRSAKRLASLPEPKHRPKAHVRNMKSRSMVRKSCRSGCHHFTLSPSFFEIHTKKIYLHLPLRFMQLISKIFARNTNLLHVISKMCAQYAKSISPFLKILHLDGVFCTITCFFF